MSSDAQSLLHHVDRFANHMLTTLLYANRHDYDVLIYVHRKQVPATTERFFYFFLKVCTFGMFVCVSGFTLLALPQILEFNTCGHQW